MPSRERLNEFIAVVEAGDHAGAIERYYTEDASMQENAGPPRVGRELLVAHERGVLARMSHVYSKALPFTGFSNSPTKPARCAGLTRWPCRNGAATRFFASGFSTIRPGRRRNTSTSIEALRPSIW